ncbi:hypothetical protein [Mucilaginibacter gilvus]|uniref:Uncharacterized protein n=1 Tax=Mucilaginibacter gilvus TaxID=2305909 RepID=A0A3S3VC20_9SPHI|nr:hypothetical protein [Mucilaginibacter gilvus]RWY50111.1 hypothetical protein EPL05_15245 [Mucilaginibacter gilvus]
MLKINIPRGSALISLGMFDEYQIPKPPNGTDEEINEDVILLFENEQQAVTYLDQLEDLADEVDDDSPQKDILNLLITSIADDEFVNTFLENED